MYKKLIKINTINTKNIYKIKRTKNIHHGMYVVAWGSFMTMHKNTSKSMKRDTVLNAKAHQAPTENLPGFMYRGGGGGGWGLYKT